MARLPLDPVYSKALILASQFKSAKKCFASSEGDHLTLINVHRTSIELLEKRKSEAGKEKPEKILRKWCKENFINSRSLRHARDIHSQIRRHVEQMGLCISSCGDDTLQFRRCLAAAFFLNAALKQPDGTYRALASGEVVQIHPTSVLFRTKADYYFQRVYQNYQQVHSQYNNN
ncbi:hypothetical protein F3Y22_tig00010263pilonHSYRG00160 [Hibiscus syriacus]|uniref:RNA helicase n=1 Tax=Hibiscus syriacus TaxID=106335 RepID=A0A6A3CAQ8_HIBSY|nr:hypothetical protein F3Y22_tig00010263pilonHSYRG00160 [Hibiscus syriacus]